jgi:hypothetical protein
MTPLEGPEQVEFVAGPWADASHRRADLPDEIPAPGGTYVRSVRCADDGAMRYVWRGGVAEAETDAGVEG